MTDQATISLFKKRKPIYHDDLVKWLDNHTVIGQDRIIIGPPHSMSDYHPLFAQYIDTIVEYRPGTKIVLKTYGTLYQPLHVIAQLGSDGEIEIDIEGFSKATYKTKVGFNDFERVVNNITNLKAFCEHTRKNPTVRIVSRYYGDIEQACFKKRMESVVDSFTYTNFP